MICQTVSKKHNAAVFHWLRHWLLHFYPNYINNELLFTATIINLMIVAVNTIYANA